MKEKNLSIFDRIIFAHSKSQTELTQHVCMCLCMHVLSKFPHAHSSG